MEKYAFWHDEVLCSLDSSSLKRDILYSFFLPGFPETLSPRKRILFFPQADDSNNLC